MPEKELLKKRKMNKDKLKKCPECHRVWERHYQTKTIRRYIDFKPSREHTYKNS